MFTTWCGLGIVFDYPHSGHTCRQRILLNVVCLLTAVLNFIESVPEKLGSVTVVAPRRWHVQRFWIVSSKGRMPWSRWG